MIVHSRRLPFLTLIWAGKPFFLFFPCIFPPRQHDLRTHIRLAPDAVFIHFLVWSCFTVIIWNAIERHRVSPQYKHISTWICHPIFSVFVEIVALQHPNLKCRSSYFIFRKILACRLSLGNQVFLIVQNLIFNLYHTEFLLSQLFGTKI